ncbi:MAG: diguanylate cyclase [Gemmatimonadaceae bacterium]
MSQNSALILAPDGQPLPATVRGWLESRHIPTISLSAADEIMTAALRTRPRLVMVDARQHPVAALKTCRRLKQDSYTGVVPVVVTTLADDAAFAAAFDAGADEVLRDGGSEHEATLRLDALLRRSDRDTFVHPSTRLPGTIEIEHEMTRRIEAQVPFAVCYADLDHFKEFNDRYSYYDGDRVIRILSRILHDIVKGICGEPGFVGHIGGDDFIFIIPVPQVTETCGTIVEVFDTLVPFQYSEQDRRAGYYFGKDRRGQLHKVPLMTLSIGVVTNERRVFTHAGQVSELATEMKSYAKSIHGSVFSVDRRGDGPVSDSPAPGGRASNATEG